MLSRRLFLSFVLAIVGALAGSTSRYCGSEILSDRIRAVEAETQSRIGNGSAAAIGRQNGAGDRSVTFPVHFHVITDDDSGTSESGNISDSRIHKQMQVLNAGFNSSRISFTLASITRTVNSTWFRNVSWDAHDLDVEMKTALRQGGVADLNIWTVGFTNLPGMYGYSTVPWDYSTNASRDGSVFLYSTLPDGSDPEYGLGRTCTHEVGHWVGLYHTFFPLDDLDCDSPGDYVDDTPAELYPAYGCPEGADTCPNNPGLDPIHNFMDYSNDTCRTEFTPGQVERMWTQITTYRGI